MLGTQNHYFSVEDLVHLRHCAEMKLGTQHLGSNSWNMHSCTWQTHIHGAVRAQQEYQGPERQGVAPGSDSSLSTSWFPRLKQH